MPHHSVAQWNCFAVPIGRTYQPCLVEKKKKYLITAMTNSTCVIALDHVCFLFFHPGSVNTLWCQKYLFVCIEVLWPSQHHVEHGLFT